MAIYRLWSNSSQVLAAGVRGHGGFTTWLGPGTSIDKLLQKQEGCAGGGRDTPGLAAQRSQARATFQISTSIFDVYHRFRITDHTRECIVSLQVSSV